MTEESARERKLREAAATAAESTFERFRDEPDSDFYEAPNRSPEETWQEVRGRVGLTAVGAISLALADADLGTELLCEWHRSIFETTFPDQAGRLRTGRGLTTYGYVVGPRNAPVDKTGRATGARKIPGRLRKICEEFNQAAGDLGDATEPRLLDSTLPAARLYAKLLSIHPWCDGNGRAAYVALQFALVRLGTIIVSLPDHAQQQWHLGRALQPRGGQSYEPLARYLADEIGAAEQEGLQSEEP